MRDSFILFTEYKEQVDMLDDEQAGVLFKAILNYTSGEEVPPMDGLTKMAFSFIRAALDRSSDSYQRKVDANRENGRRGGRPKKESLPEGTEDEEQESEEKTKVKTEDKKETKAETEKTQCKTEKTQCKTEKTQPKTQKPTGFFENPPEPDPERDSKSDPECESVSERGVWGENNTHPAPPEKTPIDRFLERFGIDATDAPYYDWGALSGIDWQKLTEKVEKSSFLHKPKNLGFFVKHYSEILAGKYDDWEDPPGRTARQPEKYDPERDGSSFANIVYE